MQVESLVQPSLPQLPQPDGKDTRHNKIQGSMLSSEVKLFIATLTAYIAQNGLLWLPHWDVSRL